MIRLRPNSLTDMLEVTGVGQRKLEKYGQIFLDVLARFATAPAEAVTPQ